MHPLKVFILTNIACANAWTIPPGTKDGIYSVIKRESGEEEHVQLEARDASPFESFVETPQTSANTLENTLEKRGTSLYCGCGFNMDHGNCDAAVADLSRQLDGTGPNTGKYINPNLSYYSIRNNVVAFACNRSPNYAWLSGQQYGDYLKRITYVCGAYIAGADREDYGVGYLILGYARYKSGDDFCGASTSSPASHC